MYICILHACIQCFQPQGWQLWRSPELLSFWCCALSGCIQTFWWPLLHLSCQVVFGCLINGVKLMFFFTNVLVVSLSGSSSGEHLHGWHCFDFLLWCGNGAGTSHQTHAGHCVCVCVCWGGGGVGGESVILHVVWMFVCHMVLCCMSNGPVKLIPQKLTDLF